MKVALEKDLLKLSNGRDYQYYAPWLNVLLVSNHNVGKSTRCYIDTGATVTIFPSEYAYAHLGYSTKSLKRGELINLYGLGGAKAVGYGHMCSIHHPDFQIKNVMIYFVENQPYPLLGRISFMDRFKRIVFEEENKFIEFFQ